MTLQPIARPKKIPHDQRQRKLHAKPKKKKPQQTDQASKGYHSFTLSTYRQVWIPKDTIESIRLRKGII